MKKWFLLSTIVLLLILTVTNLKPTFRRVLELREEHSDFYGMPVKKVLSILNVSNYKIFSSEDSQFSELIEAYQSDKGNHSLPEIDKVWYIRWEESSQGGYYAIFTYDDIVYGFDALLLWD